MALIRDVVNSELESAYVDNKPFDLAYAELKYSGYDLLTGEQNASLRIQQGTDSSVSKLGNYIKEGSLFIEGKGTFITRNSLILEDPTKATQLHKIVRDFYVTPEQAERALGTIGVDSIQVKYKITEMPTNRLGEGEVGVFIFGNQAKAYGEFLASEGVGIKSICLDLNNKYEPGDLFANQLFLFGIAEAHPLAFSNLSGSGRCLNSPNNRVRGVRNVGLVKRIWGLK